MKKIRNILLFLAVFAAHLLHSQPPASSPDIVANDADTTPLQVEFLPVGGFYHDSVTVQLLAPGAKIYFTTDGSKPKPLREMRYSKPFRLEKTTVIRALAVATDRSQSLISSHTYFIGEPETTLPVVSVSLAPGRLFDPETGLFMKGENAVDSLWQLPGANFWSRLETSCNVEFFETNGKCAWRQQAGFRLFGGMSRLFPQKSIALVARSQYGDSRFRHPIFGKKGLKKYKYLVLRNSGSDFGKTHFRDGLLTHLVKDWDLDVQAFRPAHVYLNGKYWGIYNLREKVNRYFIAAHHHVDKDSLDLIEHQLTQRTGSTAHYQRMLRFLEKNSLVSSQNFAWVNSQMEVNNFMDYQIAQIYFDNQDAGGNIKFWRPQTENGRWRWILYDTDWGFGLYDQQAYRNNSLEFHTAADGPSWPNPPWSTLILRKLLENKDFERRFVNRFADYLNGDLESQHVLTQIDRFYHRIEPEIPRHLKRWKLSRANWEAEVRVLRHFARERPAYIRRFLMEKFNTGSLRPVELGIAHGGQVIINENLERRDTFAGLYFEKVPIRLKALPDLGYRFVGWQGEEVNSESPEMLLQLTHEAYKIKAVFEKFEHPLAGKIIINEISCNNKHSGDWVEIYNASKEQVNLQDWILTDAKNEFRFPSYTLPPGGYVVVCEDSAKFVKVHPQVQSLVAGLNFGLKKLRETVQLFSPEAAAVDSVGYAVEPMDTVFTLNLLLPTLDNGKPGNWEIVWGNGSPDAANRYYVESRLASRRELWMQVGGAAGVLVLGIFLLWLRSKGRL